MTGKGEKEDTRMIRVSQVLTTKSIEKVQEKPQNHSKLLRREKRNHDKKNGLKERVVQQVTVATIAPTDVTTQGRKRKEKINQGITFIPVLSHSTIDDAAKSNFSQNFYIHKVSIISPLRQQRCLLTKI